MNCLRTRIGNIFCRNNHFGIPISSLNENLEDCTQILANLNNAFFNFLNTKFYEVNFNDRLSLNTIEAVNDKIPELKNLKAEIQTYINIESELIKGAKLIEKISIKHL